VGREGASICTSLRLSTFGTKLASQNVD
jgi:hypothetical protein